MFSVQPRPRRTAYAASDSRSRQVKTAKTVAAGMNSPAEEQGDIADLPGNFAALRDFHAQKDGQRGDDHNERRDDDKVAAQNPAQAAAHLRPAQLEAKMGIHAYLVRGIIVLKI